MICKDVSCNLAMDEWGSLLDGDEQPSQHR